MTPTALRHGWADFATKRADQSRNGPTLLEARQGRSLDGVGVGLGEPKADERKPRLQLIPGSRASYLNKWLTAEPMSLCFGRIA